MAELTKSHTTGLSGRKTRSAIIVVGVVLTVVLAGVIAFSDFEIPLYVLILIVGCSSVLIALVGSFVLGEQEELRALPGNVLEHITRRGIMAVCVTGGFLLLFYLLDPALYNSTPPIVLWLLFGIVISALSAVAVAMASEEMP